MRKNLSAYLDYVFGDEGGFVIRASEPGGAGNLGVSFTAFRTWRHSQGQTVPTFEDLRRLTRDEARAIYEAQYWTLIRGDELPLGVDYAVLDAAINLGVTGGIKALQRALKVKPDGKFGPITMAAVHRHDPKELALAVTDQWLAEKRKSPSWPRFGAGWTNRAKKVRARILKIMGAS